MLKKSIGIIFSSLVLFMGQIEAQQTLNLDQCRTLAIENNKTLKIATEQERKAHYQKKEALMQYFPKASGSGTYMHFGKDLHLIGKSSIPGSINLPPALGGPTTLPPSVQEGIYNATKIDLSNFWSLGLSLTQPIFTGGKIIALNDIRSHAKELATTMKETSMTNVFVDVDEAYWQVVSLANKTKLANSYVELLNKMNSDIESMESEGVATKADRLSVNVKLNEAEITLTKAENGLSLSKMLLCEIIGLEISDNINLTDESLENLSISDYDNTSPNIEEAVENRSEIRSLGIAKNIYKKQERIARAEFLPTAGVSLGYNWMKPNMQDGRQNKFGGMFNIGVSVSVPLNFATSSYKLKAAKSETYLKEYELEDAKEKIRLQINQSSYKLTEADKKLKATAKNTEKADENLRYAKLGFEEGVIPASDVLSAHTAWISAHAEKIDAQIDLKLCKLYLDKALGRNINNR